MNVTSKVIMTFAYFHIKRFACPINRSHPSWLFSRLPSTHVPWKSPRRAKGLSRAQEPNAFRKSGSVCGQETVLSKISWANCLQSAPAGISPFPVGWVLATLSSDYSQEDTKATALPRRRKLAAYLRTPFPKGRGKKPLGNGSLSAMPCSGKISSPCENQAFGSNYRMWKQLYVTCHLQHAKSEEFCWAATGWASTAFSRSPNDEQPNPCIFLFTSKQIPLSPGHLAWLLPRSKLN